jgi:hypothetical protein
MLVDGHRREVLQGYREMLSSGFFGLNFVVRTFSLPKRMAIDGPDCVVSSVGAVRSFADAFIFGSQN